MVLVFPQVPLLIVLAAFLGQVGPPIIALLIGLTAWPWGTRVIRAQTMARGTRNLFLLPKSWEKKWRIISLKSCQSCLNSGRRFYRGGALCIIESGRFEFLGLGDPSSVTWGTMLYWAQNNSSLYTGAWWDVLPALSLPFLAGRCLINISID